MSSFYEKLSMKIQGETAAAAGPMIRPRQKASPIARPVTAPRPKKDASPVVQPVAEAVPDGTESIDIDLFQSDARMVVFLQVSGVPAAEFMVTLSEESNTMVVESDAEAAEPAPRGRRERR